MRQRVACLTAGYATYRAIVGHRFKIGRICRVGPRWRAFSALRRKCGPEATLFTYAAATSIRSALLLAGFCVGVGAGTGTTGRTTAASVRIQDLGEPLDARWLARLQRSSAPLPKDAPVDALERILAAPQFAPTTAGPAAGPSAGVSDP